MTPLIYTSKGNVPIESLVYEHAWEDNDQMTILREYWYLDGELVKNNVHAMAKKGMAIGAEQAKI